MAKLIKFFASILLFLITKLTKSTMVLGKEMIFDEGVSHASVGFTEITFFTKTNMNSFENKVTLFDF